MTAGLTMNLRERVDGTRDAAAAGCLGAALEGGREVTSGRREIREMNPSVWLGWGGSEVASEQV